MDLSDIFSGAMTPARWRALGAYLESTGTITGPGLRVRKVGNKTILSTRRRGMGGGSTSRYVPWAPNFFTTGTAPSLVYKCRFNLGMLNDVCASNWDTEHTLPSDDSVQFVMLEVTQSDGKVTGLEIQLETTAPIEDTVLIDTPPPVWKILLGVVDKANGSMLVTTNLDAVAEEVYRESKAVITPGGEPFSRYWRWSHSPT